MNFDSFNRVTARKSYTYRRHPMYAQSFVILRQNREDGPYEPVGDYTVLDQDEDVILSEKKVMNLIALMNDDDEDEMIDLRSQAKTRMLYYRVPTDEPNKTRIVFYTLGKQGVSIENAVLSLEEGLEDAQS